MKTLTETQSRRISAAESKLPAGYSYRLHDEMDGGRTGKVYGVTLCRDSDQHDGGVGYVFLRDGEVQAQLYVADEPKAEQRRVALMLNRAASALWHKQPCWGDMLA